VGNRDGHGTNGPAQVPLGLSWLAGVVTIAGCCSSPDALVVDLRAPEINEMHIQSFVPWAPLNTPKFPPTQTFCSSVAHLGDSTSVHLKMDYESIGVRDVRWEVLGGRSLVEHRAPKENGVQVAKRLVAAGFSGCWVIALGTNDAANLNRGSHVSGPGRVARLMDVIGQDPVLWIDAATITHHGWYTPDAMNSWNQELESVLCAYPTAQVYRWSEDVEPSWFVKDGIHYNRTGHGQRARHIEEALVRAFPDRG